MAKVLVSTTVSGQWPGLSFITLTEFHYTVLIQLYPGALRVDHLLHKQCSLSMLTLIPAQPETPPTDRSNWHANNQLTAERKFKKKNPLRKQMHEVQFFSTPWNIIMAENRWMYENVHLLSFNHRKPVNSMTPHSSQSQVRTKREGTLRQQAKENRCLKKNRQSCYRWRKDTVKAQQGSSVLRSHFYWVSRQLNMIWTDVETEISQSRRSWDLKKVRR